MFECRYPNELRFVPPRFFFELEASISIYVLRIFLIAPFSFVFLEKGGALEGVVFISGAEDIVKEIGVITLAELKGKGGGKNGVVQAKVSAMDKTSRLRVLQMVDKLVEDKSQNKEENS